MRKWILAATLAACLLPLQSGAASVALTEPELLIITLDGNEIAPITVSGNFAGFDYSLTLAPTQESIDSGILEAQLALGAVGSFNVIPVPEPGTALMMGGGLMWLAFAGRRR
jgi:hypothetical protein